MIKKSIRINLESGLEARPVALLVQEASRYESTIYIQSGERRVNAKWTGSSVFSEERLRRI